jgi:hypothetical protein
LALYSTSGHIPLLLCFPSRRYLHQAPTRRYLYPTQVPFSDHLLHAQNRPLLHLLSSILFVPFVSFFPSCIDKKEVLVATPRVLQDPTWILHLHCHCQRKPKRAPCKRFPTPCMHPIVDTHDCWQNHHLPCQPSCP